MAEPPSSRQAAFDILQRVETGGAYASLLLATAEPRIPDPRDVALLHEIVLGVLRRRSALDHAISRVATRTLAEIDPALLIALRIGAYGLLFLDRVPVFAAVDTAVTLARANGPPGATGFANAVLRRVASEGRALLPAPATPGDVVALALFHSHPEWWVRRLVAGRGWDAAQRLLEANNAPAATVVRPALHRATRADLEARLLDEEVTVERCAFVEEALRVRAGSLAGSAILREGLAWVQDEASQLVPALFGRELQPRVLDLCAAPGTKTLQLAEGLPDGGFVVATDRHAGRLRRLVDNLNRFHVERVAPVAADMAAAPVLAGSFDHVLVDAPCSGTGTLRRRPEIRWRLVPEDLPALAARQSRLLDTAASLLAPRGTLVYSVCSLEPEEGADRVADLLARHSELRQCNAASVLPEAARALVDQDGALRTAPDVGELDGFYAALMRREG